MTCKKKLIEVALPLEAINKEAPREKAIQHGHPSTLHLSLTGRPLAAYRAVLFASLVDDPCEHVAELLSVPVKWWAAGEVPEGRKALWDQRQAAARLKPEGAFVPSSERQHIDCNKHTNVCLLHTL